MKESITQDQLPDIKPDHEELLRQTWILFALRSRGCWFDAETIHDRAVELKIFLKNHLRKEVSLNENGELLVLARGVSSLRPLTAEWSSVFQLFEKALFRHVISEDNSSIVAMPLIDPVEEPKDHGRILFPVI